MVKNENGKKVIYPGASVGFTPNVDVTQEFVDSEVKRIKEKKAKGEKLTEFEQLVMSGVAYEEKTGLNFTPYHYCDIRDL
jgi:hypothetical protein